MIKKFRDFLNENKNSDNTPKLNKLHKIMKGVSSPSITTNDGYTTVTYESSYGESVDLNLKDLVSIGVSNISISSDDSNTKIEITI